MKLVAFIKFQNWKYEGRDKIDKASRIVIKYDGHLVRVDPLLAPDGAGDVRHVVRPVRRLLRLDNQRNNLCEEKF